MSIAYLAELENRRRRQPTPAVERLLLEPSRLDLAPLSSVREPREMTNVCRGDDHMGTLAPAVDCGLRAEDHIEVERLVIGRGLPNCRWSAQITAAARKTSDVTGT